jgi:nucleoside-diphosphate-sugar epimerase
MKILITGSSGFIGQHLINRLTDHELYKLQSDLTAHDDIKNEVHKIKPDIVIHLAARTEVQLSFYEQTSFSDVNYTGTVNLLECMMQLEKVPKLLFASTMEVFGWQPCSDQIKNGHVFDELPIFTKDTAPNPNAPYAVAKLGCEKYIEYSSRISDLEYVSLRQTNSYGRKDNDFFVTEQIISQMIKNPNECLLGYGDPYRNFIYIDDMIDAWLSVIENFDKVKNNTLTIGPNNALTMKNHADNIARKLDWHGTIKWDAKDPRPGEIYILNSVNELKEFTGWEPKVNYNEGLDLTIETWKEIIKNE